MCIYIIVSHIYQSYSMTKKTFTLIISLQKCRSQKKNQLTYVWNLSQKYLISRLFINTEKWYGKKIRNE